MLHKKGVDGPQITARDVTALMRSNGIRRCIVSTD